MGTNWKSIPRNWKSVPRKRLAVAAAVPALAAVAGVSVALAATSGPASHPGAQPVAADVVAHQAAAEPSASATHSASATPSASAPPSTAAKPKAPRPATYTVKAGDTLSGIAGRVYASPAYWPVLYWANHANVRYANDLTVGEVLTVPAKPAKIPAPPSDLGPAAPAPAPATAPAAQTTPSSSSSSSASSSSADSSASSSGSDSSFQACVIARESGGNAQAMSASGYYGLYQFSASTWAAYGGNPADFGHASAAEQNQVFANAMAAGGESNWAPYDGC